MFLTLIENKKDGMHNMIKYGDYKEVSKKIFDELMAQMKPQALEHQKAYYSKRIADVQSWVGKPFSEYRDHNRDKYGWNFSDRSAWEHTLMFFVSTFGHKPIEIRQDYEEIIERAAANDVEELFQSYSKKQTGKIAEIVKGRRANITGNIRGNMESYLNFELEDGAKFSMQTQIVYCVNDRGTRYSQFPTTFHHAYKADGTKVVTPSQAKLVKQL